MGLYIGNMLDGNYQNVTQQCSFMYIAHAQCIG